MTGAGGDFLGLGLPTMMERLVLGAIERCLDVARQKAIARDGESQRRLDWRGNLSVLRDVLVERNYKASTADKYMACVSRFLRSVRCCRPQELRDDDVLEFLDELRQSGRGNATLRLHLCALRTVFDRLLELGITADIKHAPRPLQRRPATEEEVRQLMIASPPGRDRLVIDMLNRSKLRPGQLRLLAARTDESLSSGTWDGARKKSGSPKPVPFELTPADTQGVCWLLPSARGPGPLSTRTIRRIVERVSRSRSIHATCTALRKADDVPWQAVA
ncbi:MAG: site-specific integrase [Lentisphaerae bacterium]|jgi:hypothetical protein|nr:site-specific integrase [Lentisphaerota bacterium]MBT4814903.1 site-specific integrase [Lentisphaerota bacterium]MBT5609097.1 site-specific integrase [Lentisphaerota bacterium]MBT7057256.1 site-specific integrase [Lentisphaerota bacterium]MBT7848775.1 site-specific integrase [Lentisphaerota bacterium]